MSLADTETLRISAEYERRGRELAPDHYALNKPANLLLHEHALRGSIRMLDRAGFFPPRECRIADIGCGEGNWLLEFVQWGANPARLAGIDLSSQRVAGARRKLPQADLHSGDASHLPWPDESFDLVTQFTVFTSVLDSSMKQAMAREMVRVLKPHGAILWFDFRVDNPANRNVRGIRAREIRALFPECSVDLKPALLAPPLGRAVARWSWPLAELLHCVPLLRTHYAGLIRKACQKNSKIHPRGR
jgi:SAM-dependent methyltransferase